MGGTKRNCRPGKSLQLRETVNMIVPWSNLTASWVTAHIAYPVLEPPSFLFPPLSLIEPAYFVFPQPIFAVRWLTWRLIGGQWARPGWKTHILRERTSGEKEWAELPTDPAARRRGQVGRHFVRRSEREWSEHSCEREGEAVYVCKIIHLDKQSGSVLDLGPPGEFVAWRKTPEGRVATVLFFFPACGGGEFA